MRVGAAQVLAGGRRRAPCQDVSFGEAKGQTNGVVMPLRWLALLAALVLPLACGLIPRDELECEQAVSHLDACCFGFQTQRLVCATDGGCGSYTSPSLPLAESECLNRLSCNELRRGGYCERAQNAVRSHHSDGDTYDTRRASVCP